MSLPNADRLLAPLLSLLAGVAALILLIVILFLVHEAWPVFTGGQAARLLSDGTWYPLEGEFGMMSMVAASLAAALGAILLAAPLGLMAAVFENHFAPPLIYKIHHLLIVLLAGIPSVVFGLWGLTVLVPLIADWHPPGVSLISAIMILALMILPTVVLTSSAALRAVPESLLINAHALGMTKSGLIISVAIPAASDGILSGVLLAVARAMGETMAVLMVAGNVVQLPTSLFLSVRMLTSNIALEMGYAMDQHRAALFASGLMLTLLVLILAIAASRRARHA
jgi:phosphate transport system permease protein